MGISPHCYRKAQYPHAVAMDRGHIVYDGASATLRNDPDMIERFIGVVKG